MTSDKNNIAYDVWPLDKKCMTFFGNVQLGKFYTQNAIQIRKDFDKLFSSMKEISSYFFILHDDSHYLHVHFALLCSIQIRPITMLNKIAAGLDVDNTAISITKLKSLVGALKYFLHITDESKVEGKKEYAIDELLSNENDLIVKGYLDSESDNDISIYLIRDLVASCDTKSDVILKINNDKVVKRMRYYIDTFWNDKPILQLRQNQYDELPF